jgi:hypothetical protein
MPQMGFEPTTPVFERAKTVHAPDRAATVIGSSENYCPEYLKTYGSSMFALPIYFGKTKGTNGINNKQTNKQTNKQNQPKWKNKRVHPSI